VELDFDLATLLNAPRPLSFSKDGSSTHSRDGDPVAAALVVNLQGAFRVHKITSLTDAEIAGAHPKPLYLPEKFTPYPFQMGATFPIPDLPRDNPLTVERVELGKTLFFDKQLSINAAQSCADCHAPEKAFTDGRRTARGAEGDFGTRNAMPLFNLAWKKDFFWDGRAKSLRGQVLQPIQNPIEMHEPLTNLCVKLAATDKIDYAKLFAAAFGSPEITAEKISLALENYLLTLTSFNAKFVWRGLFSVPRRAAVPEPGVCEQRCRRRVHRHRARESHRQSFGPRQVRRAVAAQCGAHRAIYARRTLRHAGRRDPALFDRRGPQRDAGPKPRQASRRRRAVERRGPTGAGGVSQNLDGRAVCGGGKIMPIFLRLTSA
jgi:hypothetical protein